MAKTIKNDELQKGVNSLKEAKFTMDDVLSMFPPSSYKYGLLIPTIALLLDGQYTVGSQTHILSTSDRVYLESIVFYKEGNQIKQRQLYPNFKQLGIAVSTTTPILPGKSFKEVGFDSHCEYMDTKKYITIHIETNGVIQTVNMVMKDMNINDFIDKVCNSIGLHTPSEKTEFIQILAATRMVMNAA